MNHKSYIHAFLAVLLLTGALLVIGSFSSKTPKPAIAASTPGEQSVMRTSPMIKEKFETESKLIDWNKQPKMNRQLTVISTGDVRKNSALVDSDTVLQAGDH